MPQTRILIVAFWKLLAIAIVAVSGPFSHDTLVAFDFTPFLLVISGKRGLFSALAPAGPRSPIAVLSAPGGAIVALLVAGFQFVVLDNTRPGGWELSPIHFADLGVTLGFLGLGGLLVETPPRWAAPSVLSSRRWWDFGCGGFFPAPARPCSLPWWKPPSR